MSVASVLACPPDVLQAQTVVVAEGRVPDGLLVVTIEKISEMRHGGKAVAQLEAIGKIPPQVAWIAPDAQTEKIAVGAAANVRTRKIPVHAQEMGIGCQMGGVQRPLEKAVAGGERGI